MNKFILKSFLILMSLILSFAAAFAHGDGHDDDTVYTITGTKIDLKVVDHGFDGEINGNKVMAYAGCGDTPILRIFVDDEQYTDYVTYNETTKKYGIKIRNFENTRVSDVYFVSGNFNQGEFILNINGNETLVTFEYQEKDGNHFKDIHFMTNINGEDVYYHFTGEGCPNLLVTFSMMILASYTF